MAKRIHSNHSQVRTMLLIQAMYQFLKITNLHKFDVGPIEKMLTSFRVENYSPPFGLRSHETRSV